MSGSNSQSCAVKTNTGTCGIDGEDGVYGTLGVAAAGNFPGSRSGAVGWADKSRHLWLFGGDGLDSVGNPLPLNDPWEYQLRQTASITLTSSANPEFAQNSITLTASATGASGTPTGTVTFLDGATSIGTGSLNSSDSATLSINTLSVGTHTLTASYGGDANYFAASATVTQVVEDFSIVAGPTTTATISAGGFATYTFTVSPIAPATTFPSAITISASGGSVGSSWTLSPTSITGGAGSTLVTVRVAVPSNSASSRSIPRPTGNPLPLPFAWAALFLPLAGRLRKAGKWSRGIALLLLIAAGLTASTSLSGCSTGGSAATSQPQTYTITVNGAAGALSHSNSVTLTVN